MTWAQLPRVTHVTQQKFSDQNFKSDLGQNYERFKFLDVFSQLKAVMELADFNGK